MPVETPSQRDPAAAQEERGVVIFAGSVSMKFGEQQLDLTILSFGAAAGMLNEWYIGPSVLVGCNFAISQIKAADQSSRSRQIKAAVY